MGRKDTAILCCRAGACIRKSVSEGNDEGRAGRALEDQVVRWRWNGMKKWVCYCCNEWIEKRDKDLKQFLVFVLHCF